MEPREGNTESAMELTDVSTRQRRIAELAKQMPELAFTSLNHHLSVDWLKEAYHRTRKNGAVGVDGQTAHEYAENLEDNLRDLLERAKSGRYFAPPVKRVHIPKGDGKETRPIGIPTFEDKILQRAVCMLLEPIYEHDFYEVSYGFRPGRSAHDAIQGIWKPAMAMGGGWIVDADISKCFDTIDKAQLRAFLRRRIRDGVVLKLIDKWLKAGVMEDGIVHYPEDGTPQGGVISPLLSNIYLHEVLDRWYEEEVRPRLKGRSFLVRYADDFVIGCEQEEDAKRMLEVLPKRFTKYGLTIHPAKTRLVKFTKPSRERKNDGGGFAFLGFTWYWGKSGRGNWVIKWKTRKERMTRALDKIREWCKRNRHMRVPQQHRTLSAKVRGHYAYFGVTGNIRCIKSFVMIVERIWRKWLARRSNERDLTWEKFKMLLGRFPLPSPRIMHQYA